MAHNNDFDRWRIIQNALDGHRKLLSMALEIHAFNRDLDDVNERINEKVRQQLTNKSSVYYLLPLHFEYSCVLWE